MAKQLQMKMMLLLVAVLIGAGTALAADKTIKLTYSSFDLSSSSYAKKTATVDNISFTVDQGYKGTGNSIQMNSTKGSGTLYNTTAITGLKSIIVDPTTSNTRNYTITTGTSQNPTTNSQTSSNATAKTTFNANNGDTYFQLKVSGATYFLSIEIVYDDSASPDLEDCDLALTGAPIALNFDLYNNSSAQTISYTTSSTGEVSVAPSDYATFSVNQTNKTITVTPTAVTPNAQTITVSQVADETYAAGSATFTLSVANSDPNVPGTENNPYTVAQANANTPSTGNVYIKGIVCAFYNTSIMGDNANYRYYISDDGTNSGRLLVYKGKKNANDNFSSDDDLLIGDEVVIYGTLITYSNAPEVNSGNYIVSLKRKSSPELSFNPTTATCDLLAEFTEPTLLSADGFDGTVTYSSSNTSVATVDATSGEVALVGVGETTITASSEATANFQAGTASYTLTVTKREGVDPVGSEGYFVKVTSTVDLEDGEYLIVYEEGALAFDGSLETLDAASNNVSVVINNNKIAATSATQAAQFTLASTDHGWTLQSASGSYIGQTTDANGLKASETEEYANTISIDEGNAVIVSSGGAYLRYNATSGQDRFRYFKSSTYTAQKAIQLYKYVAGETSMTVELSDYGYKTLVASKNFTVSGATAYIVTAATTTSVTTQEINVVPANAPVYLKGDANAEVTLTFTEDAADDVSGNLLAVSEASQGNGCYVLAVLEGEVGFYVWAGGSLGAGRVILPADKVPSNARQFLSFNEVTGIDEIVSSKPTNGEWYDLQGRRVVKAQKGLYIMNGKKVIMK